MATWLTHFRLAEKILHHFRIEDREALLVGSIGPDCGISLDEGKNFIPPKRLSHWQLDPENWDIDMEGFSSLYLDGEVEDKSFSFYIGYYLHLLADTYWHEEISKPALIKYRQGVSWDHDFLTEVKKDWYDVDRQFLRRFPDYPCYKQFVRIRNFPNIYLPFFPEDAFEAKIRLIRDFYAWTPRDLDRSLVYFNQEMQDDFVEKVGRLCVEELKNRGVPPL